MNKEELKLEELSREQFLDLADANGRKLGFLLAISDLSQDIKDSIVNILDSATPAQLDALLEALESGFLEAKNKTLNDLLIEKLKLIKEDFDKKQNELELNTLKKLNEL